jgi:hypothetical protein
MSNNVEKWTLEDGRRAERHVSEQSLANGQQEKTIELHVEDERPLRLQQRVVERSRPIVYERTLETIDPKTGKVVEQKVEAIEPKVQMHLVEHIACETKKTKCCKEDMMDKVVEKVLEILGPVQKPAEPSVELGQRLNSLGLVDEIGNRVNDANKLSTVDKVLLFVIAAQLIGLVYIMFFM